MERRTVRGIHVIRVRGDFVERARQHARLLREEIREGALPALAKKNEWLIRTGPGIIQKKPVQDSIVWFYRNVLIPALHRQTPARMRAMMKAASEETGLPYAMLCESLFQADALMLLSRTSVMKHLLGEMPAGSLPGCTSGIALRSWTKDGRLLVGRNQDYPIVGPWERNTTVAYNETDGSGEIPFVAVTTAGVHTGGLTAMNREGLTLSTHAHFGRKIAFRGTPVVSLGDEIIRNARTIGEAVDIARKHRRHANWAFVVSSAKENDAAVIEMSPTRTFVRHAKDGFIAHSNYFHAPELRRQEALLSGAYCSDLSARICRIRQSIEPHRGAVEPSHMAEALGDHVDPTTGEERVFGHTVSVVTTIKSVVMEPETQRLWVSARKESPTGLEGEYVELDGSKLWSGSAEAGEPRALRGYRPRNPALTEGVRHYREAYREWHMNPQDPARGEKTLIALRKAVRAYPQDGHLWVSAGIVAFNQRLFEEARRYFEEARARRLDPHIARVRDLFLARCHDLAGEREKALAIYGDWQGCEEPKLRRALKRGLRRPYRAKDLITLMVDLQFPDAFQY